MASQPAFQVLTDASLMTHIVDFLPMVPYFVTEFKEQEFERHKQETPDEEGHVLRQTAILRDNLRALQALYALSKTRTFATNPHVQFEDIMGYAIARPRDLTLLDWIFETFPEHERGIQRYCYNELAIRDHLDVMQWIYDHGYEIPSYVVDFSARCGHLELIRFFHEHCSSKFSPDTMHEAATGGHLRVVKFLHRNRMGGCYDYTLYQASRMGYNRVVAFLCLHRPMAYPQELRRRAVQGDETWLKFNLAMGVLVSKVTRRKYEYEKKLFMLRFRTPCFWWWELVPVESDRGNDAHMFELLGEHDTTRFLEQQPTPGHENKHSEEIHRDRRWLRAIRTR
ncbi:hypothetical protein FI667_g3041, partial [Globisporangium splendens]